MSFHSRVNKISFNKYLTKKWFYFRYVLFKWAKNREILLFRYLHKSGKFEYLHNYVISDDEVDVVCFIIDLIMIVIKFGNNVIFLYLTLMTIK